MKPRRHARPFGVGQQTETLLEAERGGFAGLQLLLQGVGHRAQLHGVELVERLFDQHRFPAVEVGQPTEPFRSGDVLLLARGRNIGTLIGRADRGCERGPQRVADRPRHRDDQRSWATNDNGPTVAVRMPPRRNLIEPVPGPFRPPCSTESADCIYALIAEGLFPRPLQVGRRAVRWIEQEVQEWLSSRPRSGTDGRRV